MAVLDCREPGFLCFFSFVFPLVLFKNFGDSQELSYFNFMAAFHLCDGRKGGIRCSYRFQRLH